MTITTTVDEKQYSGNDVADTFSYPFKIFAEGDLRVRLINDTSQVAALQTLNSDYSVSGVGISTGGNVVFVTPPATGYTVDIRRVVDYDQQTDIRNLGAFYPSIHEDAFDKLSQQTQQVARGVARAIRADDYGPALPGFVLPNAADRAGKYMVFGGSGDLELAVTLPSGTLSQSSIGQFLYPTSDAETNEGVPIVNPFKYYGDILRYGTNTTPGTTDMAAAFTSAAAVCVAGGYELHTSINEDFYVSSQIDLRYVRRINFTGNIVVDDNLTGVPAVIIGHSSADQDPKKLSLQYVQNQSVSNPTDPLVRVVGLKNSDVYIGYCQHVQFYADVTFAADTSMSYCKFNFGRVRDLVFLGLPGVSWINENHIRGRLNNLHLSDASGGDYHHNNNVFECNFESSTILFDVGRSNKLYGRFEGTVAITFKNLVNLNNNEIYVRWTNLYRSKLVIPSTVTFTDPGNRNYITREGVPLVEFVPMAQVGLGNTLLNSSPDVRGCQGIEAGLASHAASSAYVYDSGLIPLRIGDLYLIDIPDEIWRPDVSLYDAERTLLESTGDPGTLTFTGITWNDSSDSYRTTTDIDNGANEGRIIDIQTDTVGGTTAAFLRIRLQVASGPKYFSNFGVYFAKKYIRQADKAHAALVIQRPKVPVLSGVPTTGYVRSAGYSVAKTDGAAIYTCTFVLETFVSVAGSGTDTAINLSDVTGITAGDIIGIELDDGTTHWTTTTSTATGNSWPITDALPSAAAVGRKAVINRWATLT